MTDILFCFNTLFITIAFLI